MPMSELDQELTRVFGVASNWSTYIRQVASHFCKQSILDDITATTVTEIYLNIIGGGKLCETLQKAKNAAHNNEELLHNVEGVVAIATKYRTSNERRRLLYHQSRCVPMDIEFTAPEVENVDINNYVEMIVEELLKMADNAEKIPNLRLARRYRLAAKIAPQRIYGAKAKDLMESHQIGSKDTWRKMMLDIGQAIHNIAEKNENEMLCVAIEKELE